MLSIEERLEIVIEACEKYKAMDIRKIDVSKSSSIADYFVIASGNSVNQVQGIANGVEDAMDEFREIDFIKEGYRTGNWVVLDYNDIVVHIFHKDEREFYDLERLWEERD